METISQPLRKPSRIPRLSKLPGRHDIVTPSTESPAIGSGSQKPGPFTKMQGDQLHKEVSKSSENASPDQGRLDRIDLLPVNKPEHSTSLAKTLPSRRRPRPSLSDRTAETLAQMPLSVSPKRRRSSFFQSGSCMVSPTRPASSMARTRPSTSMGLRPPLPDRFSRMGSSSPEKPRLVPTTGNKIPPKTPVKADTSHLVPRSLPPPRGSLYGISQRTPSRVRPSIPEHSFTTLNAELR